MIKGMIQGGMSSKTSVMSNAQGIFKDYKVYQDGTSDGVVFEYIYADDVEIDESQLSEDNIRQQMVAAMGADPNVREVLGKGIYMKMVYTRGDGTVIGECRITSADLYL